MKKELTINVTVNSETAFVEAFTVCYGEDISNISVKGKDGISVNDATNIFNQLLSLLLD